MSIPLYHFFPHLMDEIPRREIIKGPTSVHPLWTLQSKLSHPHIFIKREDETHSLYGGNKVRNLEFIFGSQKDNHLMTIAPLGSNFVAAFAAHASRLGIPYTVKHFQPASSPQIDAHWKFSQHYGVQATKFPGRLGTVPAFLSLVFERTLRKFYGQSTYWIPAGGSNVAGALGHVNAALELKSAPDFLVVGAGTGGTTAGLLVGFKILGFPTRILAVRCVDRIFCHSGRIVKLANRVARRLGLPYHFTRNDFDLVEPKDLSGYGRATHRVEETSKHFHELEGIRLDTTYTARVADFLMTELKSGNFRQKKVLYWHTFSPKAMEFAAQQKVYLENCTVNSGELCARTPTLALPPFAN